MIVLLLVLMCLVLLGRLSVCVYVSICVVNVLLILMWLKLDNLWLLCVSSLWIVGIGLMFIICGDMLVVVMLVMCVSGVRLRCCMVLFEVSSIVVVLLLRFEVLLVVMLVFGFSSGLSVVSCVFVVVGCGCLFSVIWLVVLLVCNVIGVIFLVS